MVIDVVMPKMGESITEGTILEWRKKVGESIETDEILLEIGTDKVDSEIPSPTSGRIITLLAELNEVVEVGKVIAQIETDVDSEKEDVILEKSLLAEKKLNIFLDQIFDNLQFYLLIPANPVLQLLFCEPQNGQVLGREDPLLHS